MNSLYNPHFKEELVATAMLMAVVISGSFFVAWRSISGNSKSKVGVENQNVLGVNNSTVETEVNEIVDQLITTPKPTTPSNPLANSEPIKAVTKISTQSAAQVPTYNDTIIEQSYGSGGNYDNLDYRLTISNPRLIVSSSRVFKVDIVLANKRIETGLKNRLSATIIKEGEVIAESVPFSLSESATVMPGEQITYSASMSLISGTDVARLKYLPLVDTVVDTIHDL